MQFQILFVEVKQFMQVEEKMLDWIIEGIINIMFFGKVKGNYVICSFKF